MSRFLPISLQDRESDFIPTVISKASRRRHSLWLVLNLLICLGCLLLSIVLFFLAPAFVKDFLRISTGGVSSAPSPRLPFMPLGTSSDAGALANIVSSEQADLSSLASDLLQVSPVAILDEATFNASAEAESLLQNLVQQKNAHPTFITAAHRLSSIMKYDRVVVMRAGRIVEVSSPAELLAKKGGIFANMPK
ncbi:hypothetical protein OC846_003906 [Tilletia horrida]|uniref:ABC transporter domain-containing protein n=1 Tax=Tilletia horrida TaxID=155126 RepID=A0AAN6GPN1_9BASI|nr:hypothetical protein OC846_003906 [Tilletia horrida]